jgi:hypothetical protein
MAKRQYHALVFVPGVTVPDITPFTNATLAHDAAVSQGLGHHTKPLSQGNKVGQAVCKVYSGRAGEPPVEVALIERSDGDNAYTVTSLRDITIQIEIPMAAVAYAIPLVKKASPK